VESEHPTEADALKANDAVLHLRHHGINAVKYRASGEDDEIADVLIEECHRLDANLLVMGSFGHSRLHQSLPGARPIGSCVARSIQYAAAFRFHRWRFGLLDRPLSLSRAMTAGSVERS